MRGRIYLRSRELQVVAADDAPLPDESLGLLDIVHHIVVLVRAIEIHDIERL